jgi:putative DNA primase/helicase
VFAATVNEDRFLVDQTGNSRFWTISLRYIRHQHDIDMQQVFAQAAACLEQGEQWWLTKAEDRQLAEYNRRHQSVSVIAERIAECVNEKPEWEPPYRTAIQVLTSAGIERPTNAQCREAGSVLRDLLGPPKRVQGRDQWRVAIRGEEAADRF